jgi:hypothetical protein
MTQTRKDPKALKGPAPRDGSRLTKKVRMDMPRAKNIIVTETKEGTCAREGECVRSIV